MDFGDTRDCGGCYIRACLSSLTQGNLPVGAKGGAAPHRYEMWLLQRVAGCTSGACLGCHGHAANTGIVGGHVETWLVLLVCIQLVFCIGSGVRPLDGVEPSSSSLPCFLLCHASHHIHVPLGGEIDVAFLFFPLFSQSECSPISPSGHKRLCPGSTEV